MGDNVPDISSVKVLLDDARERIKEAEERCRVAIDKAEVACKDSVEKLEASFKDSVEKLEARNQTRFEELERMCSALNMDLSKWNPLLTSLQKADDNKRNLLIALIVSFITNVATIALSIFVAYIKSGGSVK